MVHVCSVYEGVSVCVKCVCSVVWVRCVWMCAIHIHTSHSHITLTHQTHTTHAHCMSGGGGRGLHNAILSQGVGAGE